MLTARQPIVFPLARVASRQKEDLQWDKDDPEAGEGGSTAQHRGDAREKCPAVLSENFALRARRLIR